MGYKRCWLKGVGCVCVCLCLSQQSSVAAIQGVHRWLNRLDRLTQQHLRVVPRRGEGRGITLATNKAIKEVLLNDAMSNTSSSPLVPPPAGD